MKKSITLSLLALLALASCGQQGPLYFPEEGQADAPVEAQPAPASESAAPDSY